MSLGLGKASLKYLGMTLFLAGLFLICWNFLSFVIRNAVDMPFWDEWDIARFIMDSPTLGSVLSYQHVVHRIGFGLLIIKVLAWFSNWSQIVEIYFIAISLISTTAAVLLIKYRMDSAVSPLDLVIPLLLLNISQYENLLWGFQVSYVLPIFLLGLWVLTALAVKDKAYRNIILTVLSLFSAYSSLQGLILPVFTILFVIVEQLREKKGVGLAVVLTAAVNALIIWSYFFGFVFIPADRPLVMKPAAQYFLSVVSSGFLFRSHDFFGGLLMTLTVVAFLILGAVRYYKDRNALNSFVGVVLIGYGLVFICLVTLGRWWAPLYSRYITYTVIAPVGLFFIFSDLKFGRYLKTALLAVVLVNTVRYNEDISVKVGQTMHRERTAIAAYKSGMPSEFCYNIYKLYPDRARLDSLMPDVFRFKKISVNTLTP